MVYRHQLAAAIQKIWALVVEVFLLLGLTPELKTRVIVSWEKHQRIFFLLGPHSLLWKPSLKQNLRAE